MREVPCRLLDLPNLHPRLLWSRLEIAGRSRRADLESAWQQKWSRLSQVHDQPCYVFVAEFETLTGRLGFA